ncbi:MAG: hypothetical protein JOY54_09150 [Acidobacteriaceae bacterium]|nr:hypothetical protein [Acidobacteriaceae bacterium]
MARQPEKKPRIATGPTTKEGKGKSARNSITHGVRAKGTLILADESQEDFDRVKQGWLDEYRPSTYAQERLVEEVYLNDWFLKRAARRLHEAEAALMEHADAGWDELTEYQKRVELMLRYKTTQERSFHRALSAVQAFRKDLWARTKEEFDLKAKIAKVRAETARKCATIAELRRQAGTPPGLEPSAERALQRVADAIASLEESVTRTRQRFPGDSDEIEDDDGPELLGCG